MTIWILVTTVIWFSDGVSFEDERFFQTKTLCESNLGQPIKDLPDRKTDDYIFEQDCVPLKFERTRTINVTKGIYE